jgi:hypothetical protein
MPTGTPPANTAPGMGYNPASGVELNQAGDRERKRLAYMNRQQEEAAKDPQLAAYLEKARANPGPVNDGSMTDTERAQQKDDQLWDALTAQYQGIYKDHQNSWAAKEESAQSQMAAFQRRADAMAAMSGRSAMGLSGGSLGLGRQAMLSGMQLMNQERTQHDQQSRELQLAWLDKQIQQANRNGDFARQKQLMQLSQQFSTSEREASQQASMQEQALNQMGAFPTAGRDKAYNDAYTRAVASGKTPQEAAKIAEDAYNAMTGELDYNDDGSYTLADVQQTGVDLLRRNR